MGLTSVLAPRTIGLKRSGRSGQNGAQNALSQAPAFSRVPPRTHPEQNPLVVLSFCLSPLLGEGRPERGRTIPPEQPGKPPR